MVTGAVLLAAVVIDADRAPAEAGRGTGLTPLRSRADRLRPRRVGVPRAARRGRARAWRWPRSSRRTRSGPRRRARATRTPRSSPRADELFADRGRARPRGRRRAEPPSRAARAGGRRGRPARGGRQAARRERGGRAAAGRRGRGERGVVASVFHNRRWDGDFLTLRRLLGEGALGELLRLESRFERWRPEVDRGKWREGGGAGGGGRRALRPRPAPDRPGARAARARRARCTRRSSGCGRARRWTTTSSWRSSTTRARARTCGRSMVAAQAGPRFRALGSSAAYVKHGLDVQEDALRERRRPARPRLRRGAARGVGHARHRRRAPSPSRPSRAATSSSTRAMERGRSAHERRPAGAARGRRRDASRDRGRPAELRGARRRPAVTALVTPPRPPVRRAVLRSPACAASAGRRASSGSVCCCSSRWRSLRAGAFSAKRRRQALGRAVLRTVASDAGSWRIVAANATVPHQRLRVP